MKGPIAHQLWWGDLLYASYHEGTYTSYDEEMYCTPVMMRRCIVRQLWWGDVLYASYDEEMYCTPVMMRRCIVHQLWWGDVLYASYDEMYYTPVMMRGCIIRQLWWGDVLYASYDEEMYCTPVMMKRCNVRQLCKQRSGETMQRIRDDRNSHFFHPLTFCFSALKAGLYLKPTKLKKIFVAVITFFPFLLCK